MIFFVSPTNLTYHRHLRNIFTLRETVLNYFFFKSPTKRQEFEWMTGSKRFQHNLLLVVILKLNSLMSEIWEGRGVLFFPRHFLY